MGTKSSITMFSAKNGDSCLFEHSGVQNVAILVDGGYASTMTQHISPVLKSFRECKRQLDLVVSTHIDADHIGGLVKLVAENGQSGSPSIVPIDRVWHNSLQSLADANDRVELGKSDKELLETIRKHGYSTGAETAASEISSRQASSLAALLNDGSYNWNGSDCIVSGHEVHISPDCRVAVISPNRDRLAELLRWWIRNLRGFAYAGNIGDDPLLRDAFEFICSVESNQLKEGMKEISSTTDKLAELSDIYTPDSSITNGASIAFVLETATRRFLFLGDAWAEDVVAGLNAESMLHFDAIKISHHGSFRNTSPELLTSIDSPQFLISTDGERHNHPDLEVLKAIVDRPADFERNLIFNYPTDASRIIANHQSKSGARFNVREESNVQLTWED